MVGTLPSVGIGAIGLCARFPRACGIAIGTIGCVITGMCNENADDNSQQQCPGDAEKKRKGCQAVKDSILETCASLTGRKKFDCFQAAHDTYEQCMGQD
jgi:hypothetical protein